MYWLQKHSGFSRNCKILLCPLKGTGIPYEETGMILNYNPFRRHSSSAFILLGRYDWSNTLKRIYAHLKWNLYPGFEIHFLTFVHLG